MLSTGAEDAQQASESPVQPLAYGGWDPAAEAAGLGRSSLIDAADDGRLIVRKSGRRTVILRDDLLSFLRSLPQRTAKAA